MKNKKEIRKLLLDSLDSSRESVNSNLTGILITSGNNIQLARLLLIQVIEEEIELMGDKYTDEYDKLYDVLFNLNQLNNKNCYVINVDYDYNSILNLESDEIIKK